MINKKFTKKEDGQRKTKDKKTVIFEDDEGDEDYTDVSTDMLTSFYVYDIDMIKRNVQTDDRIIQYIEALKKPEATRIEIDTDTSHMKRWLSPEKYPFGKWPSCHSPSLMQQMAINIAISENELSNNIF